MKNSNIGIQLYPVVLLIGAFGYLYMDKKAPGISCFVLSLLLWFILFGDEHRR